MIDTPARTQIPVSALDTVLTAQFAIAWAGEGGEEKRLAWWRTDLHSKYGGLDLYQRLLPNTAEWAVFQSLRETARRKDAELRGEAHDAEELISLFSLGFDIDERLDDRLSDLKRNRVAPLEALPGLNEVVSDKWNREHFVEWLDGHGAADFTNVPAGRRLKGKQPDSLELTVSNLLAAFKPLADAYPLPHYRRSS
jgi:hypothetical protein